MTIVVTTGHQYPVGTALTNRIRSYLEVLAALGHSVLVLIYRPSEDIDNVQNLSSGVLNGVRYRSTAYSIRKPKNPIMARLVRLYSYSNCIRYLLIEERYQHIDIIIQASSSSSVIPFIWALSRITRAKYVLENSEYPWFYLKKKISNLWEKPLYERLYYRLFDGVLAMTAALQEYHKRFSKEAVRIMHLPMTVDMSRFMVIVPRENLITYIGNVSYNKDGVGILLESFISIAEQFPDWKLVIIGDTSKDAAVRQRAGSVGLDSRVILTGPVNRDNVPELLCKSKILALARPDNMQSEGGFPTKLGEYLATGNLVVITKVGEIPIYLTDKISCLMAEPGSIVSYAECLSYAIENYGKLDEVRKRGFDVCRSVFNSEVQGIRLEGFFLSMLTNNTISNHDTLTIL